MSDKINGFDVMAEMTRRNMKELKGSTRSNIKNIRIDDKHKCGWITIAVDQETAHKLITDKPLVFVLVSIDPEPYDALKKELEARHD